MPNELCFENKEARRKKRPNVPIPTLCINNCFSERLIAIDSLDPDQVEVLRIFYSFYNIFLFLFAISFNKFIFFCLAEFLYDKVRMQNRPFCFEF